MARKPVRVSSHMKKLSEHMARALRRRLPPEVAEKGKHHILDTVAAIVSGSRLRPGRLGISFIRRQGGAREALVMGSKVVTSAVNAALANGIMAHADETDDSHQRAGGHPGCAIVPAAFAAAERWGRSGADLLRAVVLGYDVGARMNLAVGTADLVARNLSTHSYSGTFGAAAATGALSGLDARGMRFLLSYAAQQASGIRSWRRDAEHVEKAFDFAGMPARNGVTAALLVAHGFTGVDDVLSGEYNFLDTFGRRPKPAELTSRLGARFEVMRTNIKKWSVGSPIQAALDATAALIEEHGVKAAEVERAAIILPQEGAVTVNNRTMPDICAQHLVAIMLIDGDVTFKSSHDYARMSDPKVRALRRRITLVASRKLERERIPRQGIVEIRLRDGRKISHRTRAVRGTSDNPMERREVETKALDLTAPVLGRKRAERLVEAVWGLERLRSVRRLRRLLTA